MNKKLLFKCCFVILFFPQISFADEMKHGDDHPEIFHAFTLEGDIGEARDGRSKNLDLSGWVGGDYNRMWLKSEKKKLWKLRRKV